MWPRQHVRPGGYAIELHVTAILRPGAAQAPVRRAEPYGLLLSLYPADIPAPPAGETV